MHEPVRDTLTEELFLPVSVRAYRSPVAASLVDRLQPEERDALGPMVPSRQAEYATARACARAALAEFDVHAPVLRADSGAPAWPNGMAGSISHTRGFCLAVAADGNHTVGVDVEIIDRMKTSVERRILVDDEHRRLHGLDDDARRTLVTTIFAAKEAFYKAHYMFDPRYLRFDVISVVVDGPELRFTPASGDVSADVLARVRGRTRIEDGRAIVGVAIDTTGLARPLPSPT